jgi:tripartite ATP-independent transporter DctM subunit
MNSLARQPRSSAQGMSGRLAEWISAGLGHIVGVAAALLLLAEIGLLLAGVIARYVLHRPIVWVDELTSTFFIWLALLGAVLASRAGAHMRLTALVDRLPGKAVGGMDALASAAAILFLALLFHPAYEYAADESFITTPNFQISGAWRASALPIAIGLMLAITSLNVVARRQSRTVAAMLLVAAAAGTVAVWLNPFAELGNVNLIIFFVGVILVGVLAGIPIAFAFGLATFSYVALATTTPTVVLIGRLDEGMSHLILLSVPLFVFLGLLIEMTGMARAMVQFLAGLLGHVRGGLSYVLVGAMYLVSGISGSKAADMAAIAPVLFPEMRRRGAKDGELVALLAATGAQTETVPPSIVLITLGSVTGVSIAALFTAGLLPAVLLGATLCFVIWLRSRRENLPPATRKSVGAILRLFVVAIPALALPFIIRAAVVEGVATATEVSTLGIVYSALIGMFIYRQFEWKRLYPMLVETAVLCGSILFIIGCATAVAWALTQSGFSQDLALFLRKLPGGPLMFLFVSVVAFIVLGSLLEGIPAIVLFGPLMFPIAHQVGIDEVHYAMVIVIAMGVGLFMPPFGLGYYIACAIGQAKPSAGIPYIRGYMIALLAGLIVLVLFPAISTVFVK